MNDATIHNEVILGDPGYWRLCFQWVTYTYASGDPNEQGYRFIWRRADNSLQPARGQARIPSIADLHTLLAMAARAGWLTSVEPPGANQELTRPISGHRPPSDD